MSRLLISLSISAYSCLQNLLFVKGTIKSPSLSSEMF